MKLHLLSRAAALDPLLLAAVLAGLNVWVARHDFGWLQLNPSPFFLLPVLIGGRFGFFSGTLAGFVGLLAILAGRSALTGTPLSVFLLEHRFFLTSLIVMGAICGELQRLFQRKLSQTQHSQEQFEQRIKQLDTELYFLREAKSELDLVVATRDSELWTLEAEIRELHQSSPTDFYQKLLAILNRHAHLSDGAIYAALDNGILERQAVFGSSKLLPEQLRASEVEMVHLALERKTAVTIPEFWRRDFSQHRNYLITSPILGSDDQPLAMLIVTGMPFFALNQKTVHLLTVICRWAAKVIEARVEAQGRFRLVGGQENHRIFSATVLRQNVALAFHSYQTHHLPSTLALLFVAPDPALSQTALEEAVVPLLRPTDCAAQLDLPFPHLGLLLPLTGERAALDVLQRIELQCAKPELLGVRIDHRVMTLDSVENLDELWSGLLGPAYEAAPHPK